MNDNNTLFISGNEHFYQYMNAMTSCVYTVHADRCIECDITEASGK